MRPLTIRHLTTYRYRQPVAFGEHRLMLRPRDEERQKVVASHLNITPTPESLHFVQDDFGNHVAIAHFAERAAQLQFESVVVVEHEPMDVAASASLAVTADQSALSYWTERPHEDPQHEVDRWASQFAHPEEGTVAAFDLSLRLSRAIHGGFLYRRREAKGIQDPRETIRLGHGSCRDFAVLMIDAARALDLPARFASGYRATPADSQAALVDPSGGATHAWAQIHIPGCGWIDFDPTSGAAGRAGLITVAVVRDPVDAIPLHGTYTGHPSDALGMDVRVQVTSGA